MTQENSDTEIKCYNCWNLDSASFGYGVCPVCGNSWILAEENRDLKEELETLKKAIWYTTLEIKK